MSFFQGAWLDPAAAFAEGTAADRFTIGLSHRLLSGGLVHLHRHRLGPSLAQQPERLAKAEGALAGEVVRRQLVPRLELRICQKIIYTEKEVILYLESLQPPELDSGLCFRSS